MRQSILLVVAALGLAPVIGLADGSIHRDLPVKISAADIVCETTDMHDGFFVTDARLRVPELGPELTLAHGFVSDTVTRSTPARPEPCLLLDALVDKAATHGGTVDAHVDFSGCIDTGYTEHGMLYQIYREFLTITFANGLRLTSYDSDLDVKKHSLHCP